MALVLAASVLALVFALALVQNSAFASVDDPGTEIERKREREVEEVER